ncbi:MAG: hypothetical protein ACJ77K_06030 [Bacteroidia bacterium]
MEEFNNDQMNTEEAPKRPVFLTVLCVLTFIASGLAAIFSLAMPLMKDWFIAMMQSNPNMDEKQYNDAMKAFDAGPAYFLLSFVLAAGSVVGAAFMWKLKRNGFHIYAFSNLALLFLPTLMLDMPMNMISVILTVLFIGLYTVNWKVLK